MKSPKNIVRDILRAQGIWDEPTVEAVKVLEQALAAESGRAYIEGEVDAGNRL